MTHPAATMRNPRSRPGHRRSFTLVELLVVLAVIAILAATALSAMHGVQENARVARTKSQISRINEQIMLRYERYKGRPVNPSIDVTMSPREIAARRLQAVRELMRYELPDRRSDVLSPAAYAAVGPTIGTTQGSEVSLPQPALARAYWRRVQAAVNAPTNPTNQAWTEEYDSAECLYMIVASLRDGGTRAIDFFKESDIGDIDEDGMPELLDGWGNPIMFIRWAPDYVLDLPAAAGDPPPVLTMQTRDPANAPDPFDVLLLDMRTARGVDPRDGTASSSTQRGRDDPFALFPLIYSAGQDEDYDILRSFTPGQNTFDYSTPTYSPVGLRSDPFVENPEPAITGARDVRFGFPADVDELLGEPGGDGRLRYQDNITNHGLDASIQQN